MGQLDLDQRNAARAFTIFPVGEHWEHSIRFYAFHVYLTHIVFGFSVQSSGTYSETIQSYSETEGTSIINCTARDTQ